MPIRRLEKKRRTGGMRMVRKQYWIVVVGNEVKLIGKTEGERPVLVAMAGFKAEDAPRAEIHPAGPRKPEAEALAEKWRAAVAARSKPPEPCPRCVKLAWSGQIRAETVMPLPVGADAPLAEDGSGPCCHDCQAADTINKTILGGRGKPIWGATQQGGQKHPLERGMPFYAVRIVVGNERQEQLRLPEGMRPHFGLVAQGLVRQSTGTLEDHQAWLASVGIHLHAFQSED